MAKTNAERQREYRDRKRRARLAAVPPLSPAGDDAGPVASGALGPAGLRLWESATGDFDLDEHECLILRQACRSADRLEAIAAALDGAPLTVSNARGDLVAHPLLNESRQQSLLLARLCAALRLPAGEEGTAAPERSSRRTHRPAFIGVYSGAGQG